MQLNEKLKYMTSAQNVLNMNLWITSKMTIYQIGMKLCSIYCAWNLVTVGKKLTMKW